MNSGAPIARLQSSIDEYRKAADHYAKFLLGASWSGAKRKTDSPIEQLFYSAWFILMRSRTSFGHQYGDTSTFLTVTKDSQFFDDEFFETLGTSPMLPYPTANQFDQIFPQAPIGSYHVDFKIRRWVTFEEKEGLRVYATPFVIVECDGHDFHERTKEQAAHDKKRDRFLQQQGHPVLRFTGSELWKDPHACALQVDEFLDARITDECKRAITEDDRIKNVK